MKTLLRGLILLLALFGGAAQAQFDHGYAAWDALLKKHVRWLPDQKGSRVDYAGLQADRAALHQVLTTLSAVPQAEFDGWTKTQRMAFLVNAYNAFTVELILTRYPDLKSIKDLGSFIQSPWKKKFFRLLGQERHLDWIEHEQLRPLYAEPRVHAAVNCASIGCPALRSEAFTAATLEAQLEDGMRRFLADRTRNRVREGRLEVSAIFKWFREDFEQGWRGWHKLEDVFASYAGQLSDDAQTQTALRARSLPVVHLDYDWSLNALGR
ncbi:DUF547 domain-containing protein [uncultured Piscinibacter sp.]|uniref:DUF547 domain-containing protein n=1 Tax=uncultured Piscinibacter sp. TaxID=1131835 RepID=UPI00260FA9BE|nr:DUF547 domain-containing protein [uncultured Piscinibacter sp.]